MTRQEKNGLSVALMSLYLVAIAIGISDPSYSLLLLVISATCFFIGWVMFFLGGEKRE